MLRSLLPIDFARVFASSRIASVGPSWVPPKISANEKRSAGSTSARTSSRSIFSMIIYQLLVANKLISSNIIGCVVNIVTYLGFYFYKKYLYVEKNKEASVI